MMNIEHGINSNLVLVNQVIDYENRGEALQSLSVYEYFSFISKRKGMALCCVLIEYL